MSMMHNVNTLCGSHSLKIHCCIEQENFSHESFPKCLSESEKNMICIFKYSHYFKAVISNEVFNRVHTLTNDYQYQVITSKSSCSRLSFIILPPMYAPSAFDCLNILKTYMAPECPKCAQQHQAYSPCKQNKIFCSEEFLSPLLNESLHLFSFLWS